MKYFSAVTVCMTVTVTVTVTKALVLRPLLEDRRHITESICILVTVDRMEEKGSVETPHWPHRPAV